MKEMQVGERCSLHEVPPGHAVFEVVGLEELGTFIATDAEAGRGLTLCVNVENYGCGLSAQWHETVPVQSVDFPASSMVRIVGMITE